MRVAHVGNLANVGSTTCNLLRRKGFDAHAFIRTGEPMPDRDGTETRRNGAWVHRYGLPQFTLLRDGSLRRVLGLIEHPWLAAQLATFDLVHSWTGTLGRLLFAQEWLAVRGIPYIASATGSDLREETLKPTLQGALMRRHFRNAALTITYGTDAAMLQQIDALALQHHRVMPFPIDTDTFTPLPQLKEKREVDVVFFHPSRLDWGIVDDGPFRSSMKDTDRFFRAFARFVHEGGRGIVVVLDRGSDRHVARTLFHDLGIERNIRWKKPMNKLELLDAYRQCDIVVDQFRIGSFGLIALEAMACGKPVMMYLDEQRHVRMYPELAPIYNGRTEEDLYRCIKLAACREHREELGRQARAWIMKYHDWHVVIDRLIGVYEAVVRGARRT